MELDLDRVLAATRAGQWSVNKGDRTGAPVQGAEALSRADRRALGMALVFVAGLEEQAARVFALCADYVDDARAKEIYGLFAQDERRHADAERKLAARFGVHHRDLPRATRWMLESLAGNFNPPTRGVHEVSSATILLFELGLDSLIPALRDKVAGSPLQEEVFRRIDRDESRHLAMDYWLLDRKGGEFGGRPLAEVLTGGQPRSLRERITTRYILWRTMVAFVIGFAANGIAMRDFAGTSATRSGCAATSAASRTCRARRPGPWTPPPTGWG